jgi:ribosomal protein S16
MSECFPGIVAFMGSGETTPNGGLVFEAVTKTLPASPIIGILETPAGFELNSTAVARRIADYIAIRLQNYSPRIELIPARNKESAYSTNSIENVRSVMGCDMVFLGPGSPSYAVRQLKDSLIWDAVRYRFRQGAALVLASAACIAMGKFALPIYEIFKVGEDPYWKEGLDLLNDFGLSCVIVPHWNNAEGGKELDTSRCFIGKERFETLAALLPKEIPIIGICEHTGLLVDLNERMCSVIGKDSVVIIKNGIEQTFINGTKFPLTEIGDYYPIEAAENNINLEIIKYKPAFDHTLVNGQIPTDEVLQLAEKRELARKRKEWETADKIRKEIEHFGWQVIDTPDGYRLEQL